VAILDLGKWLALMDHDGEEATCGSAMGRYRAFPQDAAGRTQCATMLALSRHGKTPMGGAAGRLCRVSATVARAGGEARQVGWQKSPPLGTV